MKRWLLLCVAFFVCSLHSMDEGSEEAVFDAPALSNPRAPSDSSITDAQGRSISSRMRKRRKAQIGPTLGNLLGDACRDVFILNKNLFAWDTLKIIATTFPAFVGARMIDEKLQNCFYDGSCHKNVNQLPKWCHEFAKASIGIPIVLLGSDIFFSKDPDHRWTAQILLVGMPFVIWTKTLVKKMEFDCFRRPWNQKFSSEQRSYGGFPSGHMAQALYMTLLYGMRYGPRYAIPLGAMATFIGATFVSCNRHYISQIIGGAAFGSIYAMAANKLVESKMTKNVKLALKVDPDGRPTMTLSLNW